MQTISSSSRQPAALKNSLAQWSLHRAFRNKDKDSRDFAKIAKDSFNIEAIEYSSQFLADHVSDKAYMNDLNKRADDHGVKQLLIMCDNEGMIGDPSARKRTQALLVNVRKVLS